MVFFTSATMSPSLQKTTKEYEAIFMMIIAPFLVLLTVTYFGAFFFLYGELDRLEMSITNSQAYKFEEQLSFIREELKQAAFSFDDYEDALHYIDGINKAADKSPESYGENEETLLANDEDVNKRRIKRDKKYESEHNLPILDVGGTELNVIELVSTSKIKYKTIEEFCILTNATCPSGPVGPKGNIGITGAVGSKGDNGRIGKTGPKGMRGEMGAFGTKGVEGPVGQKGDQGQSGKNGIDGLDGFPGKPGGDGTPGRNGRSGRNMTNTNGPKGERGLNGCNGKDGTPGGPGLKGSKGSYGYRGYIGPNGRNGEKGLEGLPARTVIDYWVVDDMVMNKMRIKPVMPAMKKKLKVNENDNLRLQCMAAGYPKPINTWSRIGGQLLGTEESDGGKTISIAHINKNQAGIYVCKASNDFGEAEQAFEIQVLYKPYIRRTNGKVGAYNGYNISLECSVDSFPKAKTIWHTPVGKLRKSTGRHELLFIPSNESDGKGLMIMNIWNVTEEDFGNYNCLARNKLSSSNSGINVYKIDLSREMPESGKDGISFTQAPYYALVVNESCTDTPKCCQQPEKQLENKDRVVHCIRVKQFAYGYTYPGYKKRAVDCVLSSVEKPIYQMYKNSSYGSWLKDPSPRNNDQRLYYWTTTPDDPKSVYEYQNKTSFQDEMPIRKQTLPFPFTGSGHVIYKGSFIYQAKGTKKLIKFDLESETYREMNLPDSLHDSDYLYTSTKNFIDLHTDENGLWGIFSVEESNNTMVLKIDESNMKIEYGWNISLNHHNYGEMFITCGVLYALDSSSEKVTHIRFALDLYKNNILDVDLIFTNPFNNTTILGYNFKDKELYSWAGGNQLTYPIMYIDIGYKSEIKRQRLSEDNSFSNGRG